jgi:hypothetical protein
MRCVCLLVGVGAGAVEMLEGGVLSTVCDEGSHVAALWCGIGRW